ncbi:hypothetical protein [Paracoccus jeotgali]|uniref:hypothetical protein n=1 Tax=Paracoccus jeotgali TaxID=2065379 RepID=UPI0028A6AF36|nr:hypothetical protein [Paracoccus jeotgali]
MRRLIAAIVAFLVLLAAGWWGWSNPELLPAALREGMSPRAPVAGGLSQRPVARPLVPQPKPEPAPPETPMQTVQPVPATPAAQDSPLPPDTGSDLARETERVAELAIAAADARARAAAVARAEAEAAEAAQADLRAALQPLLDAPAPDGAEVEAALQALPPAGNPLVARKRAQLADQIRKIITQPDPAPDTAQAGSTPPPADTIAPPDAAPSTTLRAPQIARIRELLS